MTDGGGVSVSACPGRPGAAKPENARAKRGDPGVAIRRIKQADQPVRQVLAVTRTAVASTLPVRTMISALRTQADIHQLPGIGKRVHSPNSD